MHLHFDYIHDHLFLTVKRNGSFIFPLNLIPCPELSSCVDGTVGRSAESQPLCTVSEKSDRGCAVYFKALQIC